MADGGHSARTVPQPSLVVRPGLVQWLRSRIVWLLLAGILVVLIANPLLRLVLISFQARDTGAWTLDNYIEAFGRARYLLGFRNSLVMGLGVSALAVVLGVPIAWAVSRTDMPWKGLVRTLVLATFVTPPFLGATAWILLAGPKAGWVNVGFKALFQTDSGPFNIYSFPGIIFVIAIYSFPYVFVFTTAALELVSSEMDDAAAILGAGRLKTIFRITLPLVLPAILSASVLTFLEAISLISSTIMVAIPARVNLIPLQLWEFFSYPLRVEAAAAYSMPLLAIAVAMFWFQKAVLGRKGYVALTGKGGQRRPTALGALRWAMLGYCLFVLTLSVILPYGVLAQAAFSHSWTKGLSLANLSFENFTYLFAEQGGAAQSIVNTFLYSSITAFVAVLLAISVAYITTLKLLPWGNALSALTLTPLVVPGIVLAIGFYASYAPPPLSLSGTATILILAFVTRFLPIAFANASSAMRGVNPEMEEAARGLGAGRFLTLRRILTPLLKRNLAGAWLLVFILSSREVSSALFLYGPKTRTMSVLFFDLTENGRFEVLCALGIILLATTLVFVFIGQGVIGRDFMLRRDS